jgi:4-hydroxy-4-methyl-2-oxoglutarate aldolase
VFVAFHLVDQVLSTAQEIRDIERRQAELVQGGQTLSKQLRFDDYLRKRSADPAYAFRDHVKQIGGAIEE